jgi:hypothetical protein
MHPHAVDALIECNRVALHRHEGEGADRLDGFHYRNGLFQSHGSDPTDKLVAIYQ